MEKNTGQKKRAAFKAAGKPSRVFGPKKTAKKPATGLKKPVAKAAPVKKAAEKPVPGLKKPVAKAAPVKKTAKKTVPGLKKTVAKAAPAKKAAEKPAPFKSRTAKAIPRASVPVNSQNPGKPVSVIPPGPPVPRRPLINYPK
jgi:hypothetical protein